MQTTTREPNTRAVTIGDVLDLPPLIRPATAARVLLVSEETALRLIREGQCPATKVGKHWRVRTIDFLDWLGLSRLADEMQPVRQTGRKAAASECRRSIDLSDILARVRGSDGR